MFQIRSAIKIKDRLKFVRWPWVKNSLLGEKYIGMTMTQLIQKINKNIPQKCYLRQNLNSGGRGLEGSGNIRTSLISGDVKSYYIDHSNHLYNFL